MLYCWTCAHTFSANSVKGKEPAASTLCSASPPLVSQGSMMASDWLGVEHLIASSLPPTKDAFCAVLRRSVSKVNIKYNTTLEDGNKKN